MVKRSLVLWLLCLLIGGGVLQGSNRHRQRQHASGQPGAFDYYVLALSWSPEFCRRHPTKAECVSGKFGFVVHGLWPQYANGYPENCSTAPGLADPSRMADIMQGRWRMNGLRTGRAVGLMRTLISNWCDR